MLEISTEIRRGIFFVRLDGILDKTTVNKLHDEVTNMIKDNGIKTVVFNLDKLNSIDFKGINALLYNYEIIHSIHGQVLICNLWNNPVRQKLKKSRLLNYMMETSDELSALNIIKI